MKNTNKQTQYTIRRYTDETIVDKDGKIVMKPYYIDGVYRKGILDMIHNKLDFTEVDGKKITLLQKFKTDDVCNIIVNIEGI